MLAAMFVPEEDGLPEEDVANQRYLCCRREDVIGHRWIEHDILCWF